MYCTFNQEILPHCSGDDIANLVRSAADQTMRRIRRGRCVHRARANGCYACIGAATAGCHPQESPSLAQRFICCAPPRLIHRAVPTRTPQVARLHVRCGGCCHEARHWAGADRGRHRCSRLCGGPGALQPLVQVRHGSRGGACRGAGGEGSRHHGRWHTTSRPGRDSSLLPQAVDTGLLWAITCLQHHPCPRCPCASPLQCCRRGAPPHVCRDLRLHLRHPAAGLCNIRQLCAATAAGDPPEAAA